MSDDTKTGPPTDRKSNGQSQIDLQTRNERKKGCLVLEIRQTKALTEFSCLSLNKLSHSSKRNKFIFVHVKFYFLINQRGQIIRPHVQFVSVLSFSKCANMCVTK